jgi:hypothetical protein
MISCRGTTAFSTPSWSTRQVPASGSHSYHNTAQALTVHRLPLQAATELQVPMLRVSLAQMAMVLKVAKHTYQEQLQVSVLLVVMRPGLRRAAYAPIPWYRVHDRRTSTGAGEWSRPAPKTSTYSSDSSSRPRSGCCNS